MVRPRKFRKGDVALTEDGQLAAVVDYRQYKKGQGQYRIVRLQHWPAGRPWGRAIWVDSHLLEQTDGLGRRPTAVQTYRANARMVDRGCVCECCVHDAIPPAMVLGDGSYRWEASDA